MIHQGSLDDLARVLEDHQLDYIVGSVHHANGIPIDFDKATFDQALASFDGKHEALCNSYFDQQYALIQRFQPEVIGHFDLCRLYHPEVDFRTWPSTWAKIARNVEAAVEYGALFEINGAAFRKGWNTAYPGAEVLQVSCLRKAHCKAKLTLITAHEGQRGNVLLVRRLPWAASVRSAL